MYTKKTSLFLFNIIVITVLSCIANLAFAQSSATSTGTTSIPETTSAMEKRPSLPVPENTSLREIKNNALSVQTQGRIINLIANISNRIEAAITRLEVIHKRATARSEKLAAASYDMTTVNQYLSEAQNALTLARTQMEDIDKIASGAISSDNPREMWKSVREILRTSAEALYTAKMSLQNTIGSMKLATIKTTATTTATTSDEINESETSGE